LLGTAVTLIWYLTGSPRSLGLLPVLIPLTILAAAGADRLRRSAASAFDWFGLMTFTFCASMIWLGGSAQIFGWPPAIARNFDKLAPGHSTNYSLLALTFAIVLTAGWLLSWRLRSASLRWAAGTTLMWALTTVLWLSWIDYAKSYRPVVTALHAALPQGSDCIERDTSLGTSQRASLDYFAGIRTVAPSRKRQCNWRLSIDANDRATPVGWIETWRGGRPSDRKERWYLDRRAQ